jgi:hypothetical protein
MKYYNDKHRRKKLHKHIKRPYNFLKNRANVFKFLGHFQKSLTLQVSSFVYNTNGKKLPVLG